MRFRIRSTAVLLGLALAAAAGLHAQFVTPTGYTFNTPPNTDVSSGTFYFDASGHELTDDTLGVSWSNYHSLSDADAVTGWFNVSPTIAFEFSGTQTFSRVEVGTFRFDGAGINPLTGATVAGSTFTSGITLADDTRDWLVFDGPFTTTLVGGIPTLSISLTSAPQWIMLDEVRFTAIPEPASTALASGVLLLGLALVSRRRRAGR